ncbi:MAG: hypothetical protein DHS20C19_15690 [Acidimicrobiales bacterium]|nr:MAG: hypothetical protein DHS20C19_15690 [Acidimicrobiales bacterium]
MAKWKGEPPVDGVFSHFVDTRLEFNGRSYGRAYPVLGPNGDIVLEPGEETLLTATASDVSEYFRHGPNVDDGRSLEWAQLTPVTVMVTTKRLVFVTDDLPINVVQRKVLKRHGTRHAGHVRWIWIEGMIASKTEPWVALGMAANRDAKQQFVGSTPIAPRYRRFLRIGFDPRSASVAANDFLAAAGSALVDDRLERPEMSTDYRARLNQAREDYVGGRNYAHDLVGVLPVLYKSRDEFNHPRVCGERRRELGNVSFALRGLEEPLRVDPVEVQRHEDAVARRQAERAAEEQKGKRPLGTTIGPDPIVERDIAALGDDPTYVSPGDLDLDALAAFCQTRLPDRRGISADDLVTIATELGLSGFTATADVARLLDDQYEDVLERERNNPPTDADTKQPTTYTASGVLAVALRAHLGLTHGQYRNYVKVRPADDSENTSAEADPEPVSETPAGWYPDPDGGAEQRYWDGAQWTDHRTPKPNAEAEAAAANSPTGPGVKEPFTAAPDWYPDPHGENRLRYWDGQQWTGHVAD